MNIEGYSFTAVTDMAAGNDTLRVFGSVETDKKVRMVVAKYRLNEREFEGVVELTGDIRGTAGMTRVFAVGGLESRRVTSHMWLQQVFQSEGIKGRVGVGTVSKGSEWIWEYEFAGMGEYERLRWASATQACEGHFVVVIPKRKQGAGKRGLLESLEVRVVGTTSDEVDTRAFSFEPLTYGPVYVEAVGGEVYVARHFSRFTLPKNGERWRGWDGYVIKRMEVLPC